MAPNRSHRKGNDRDNGRKGIGDNRVAKNSLKSRPSRRNVEYDIVKPEDFETKVTRSGNNIVDVNPPGAAPGQFVTAQGNTIAGRGDGRMIQSLVASQYARLPPGTQTDFLMQHRLPANSSAEPLRLENTLPAKKELARRPRRHHTPQVSLGICGNCFKPGHEVKDCISAARSGFIEACPFHNTRAHSVDVCAVGMKPEAVFRFMVKGRAGKPPIATREYDWPAIVTLGQDPEHLACYPWSRRFASAWQRNPANFHLRQDYDYATNSPPLPSDPKTCSRDAVFVNIADLGHEKIMTRDELLKQSAALKAAAAMPVDDEDFDIDLTGDLVGAGAPAVEGVDDPMDADATAVAVPDPDEEDDFEPNWLLSYKEAMG